MNKRDAFPVMALMALAATPAAAGEDAVRAMTAAAPLMVPHTLQLDLDRRAARRSRAGTFETSLLLDPAPGLRPVTWPRNSDMRARLLTPELRSTPLFGWIASSLYRDRRENGWSLEVDPGDGEYVVFYRVHR